MKFHDTQIGNIGYDSGVFVWVQEFYQHYTIYFKFSQITKRISPLRLYTGWSIFEKSFWSHISSNPPIWSDRVLLQRKEKHLSS